MEDLQNVLCKQRALNENSKQDRTKNNVHICIRVETVFAQNKIFIFSDITFVFEVAYCFIIIRQPEKYCSSAISCLFSCQETFFAIKTRIFPPPATPFLATAVGDQICSKWQ